VFDGLNRGALAQGMEHRDQPRRLQSIVVTIDGRDNRGDSFKQKAVASDLSRSGALLSGITKQVRSGDLIWVEYGDTRSRFKVVWVRDSESHQLIQAAIHLLKADPCPWAES